jgi:hypothetical protein
MLTFQKIQVIGFVVLFISSIIYSIYHNVTQESAWEGNPKTKATRARYHSWVGRSIRFKYKIGTKEYSRSEHYSYPEFSPYDEWCNYVVEYPVEYPQYGRLRTDSCISKRKSKF